MTVRIALIVLIIFPLASAAADNSFHGHGQGHQAGVKLNYDSLFNAAGNLKDSPDGQELILKCISAYGGAKHLLALETFHLTYNMSAFMVADTIRVDKYYQKYRKYKIVRHQPDQREARIINGADSWFVGRDTVIEFFSGKYKAELFSYLTLSLPLAMTKERFDAVRYGLRPEDSLAYVYMLKHDSLMIIAGIDPKDGLIKKSEGVIYQEGQTFVFINYFSDFREVDGYLFPHVLKNISMGLEVANSRLVEVRLNPEFDSSLFMPTKPRSIENTY